MTKSPATYLTAFNAYTANRLIGEGGSGRVFEAADPNGAVVAINILNPNQLTTERVKRFKNETYFCLKNQHKNLITVLDYGLSIVEGTACPFYVMPLFDETLRTLIRGMIR